MHVFLVGSLLAASLASPRDPSAIINGQEAENCAWPSVVALTGASGALVCSGTLVHPYIVATAAHCLSGPGTTIALAQFGESGDDVDISRDIEFCEFNPEFPVDALTPEWDNSDFAFCKLVEPVENVPIIPIAYGCELDAIQAGVEVVAVGFGRTQTANDNAGTKRFAQSVLSEVDPSGELIAESITCYGDSGGGYFMQLPGGELRQISITSYGQTENCSSASVSTATSSLVPFVFEVTGIDIAPCHDIDGEWAPDGSCGGIPLEPHVGGDGNYGDGCPTGALSAFESTCGASVDETPDTTAPTIAIASPQTGEMIDSMGGEAIVSIELETGDGDGWGVAFVELVLEDLDGASDTERRETPPYAWNATLPNGAYYLRGIAQDYAGNRAESDWVSLGVGVPAPPPREDEVETTEGGSSSDDGSESTSPATTSTTGEPPSDTSGDGDSTAAGEDTEDEGCGCRNAPASGGALVLLLLAALRRRGPCRLPCHIERPRTSVAP